MSTPGRILYLHWNAVEAEQRAARLEAMGFQVEWQAEIAQRLADIRANPPALVLIDLERLPSHGREAAMGLRSYKDTRSIPILFLGGEADKVERVRASLPDAQYCDWSEAASMIPKLLANPPADPQRASSIMEAYAGAPLAKKLGVKAGLAVLLIGAPEDFTQKFQDGPQGVQWVRQGEEFTGGLVLWFVRSRAELMAGWNRVASQVGKEGLWVIWPKQASGVKTDLKQQAVREIGLAGGLVDFKICSVDEVWSGLKFARRK